MIRIPVYHVTVPEYKLKKFRNASKKIDKCLKKHFLGKEVIIRALSSEEHKGKSINDLINIIKKLGYDKYDSERKGDRYKNIEKKHIDFFALKFKIKMDEEYFKQFIEPFYYWPIADRGKPIRIDIAIIYDPTKLEVVEHRYKGREKEVKRDGYIFKNPSNKPDAILGIIKIL